jgi:hypothetical protein
MNAQTAWQAAVGQLQMEMSKASFETWVRSTEVVKYEEGYCLRSEYKMLMPAIGWKNA